MVHLKYWKKQTKEKTNTKIHVDLKKILLVNKVILKEENLVVLLYSTGSYETKTQSHLKEDVSSAA